MGKYDKAIGMANEAFYRWEKEVYKDGTPLSDDDRMMWVTGFLSGLSLLANDLKHPEAVDGTN